jgi:hypothetical protein
MGDVPDMPSDNTQEKSNETQDISEEMKNILKSTQRMLTPMYIELLVEWPSYGMVTIIFKDEANLPMARCLVSKETLRDLKKDLNEIFKDEE